MTCPRPPYPAERAVHSTPPSAPEGGRCATNPELPSPVCTLRRCWHLGASLQPHPCPQCGHRHGRCACARPHAACFPLSLPPLVPPPQYPLSLWWCATRVPTKRVACAPLPPPRHRILFTPLRAGRGNHVGGSSYPWAPPLFDVCITTTAATVSPHSFPARRRSF